MIKKICDFLAHLPMTIVGGVFLFFSFILPKLGYSWGKYLAWVTVVISGIPLLYLAIIRIIKNKGISKISSAFLISIAMIAAIIIGDLFASGEVAFIMAIGAILEEKTTEKAKTGLKNLISITPKTGRILKDNKPIIVDISEIKEGDILQILPGESIPVDSVLINGETSVDQSFITGESLPIDKTKGDFLYSGTINTFGAVNAKALKIGKDSSIQKLILMVQEAEKKQAPIQRIADKWASWLVPVALIIAILAYLATGNIVRAVTVLVVFCPCALVLSTPTAIMAAIGQATKYGIIIKNGETLELMGSVNTIAFDKTGTFTFGKLEVSDIFTTNNIPETDLLQIASSLESKSEHPLAKAISQKANLEKITIKNITDFKMTAGKGISAIIDNKKYYCGKEKYILENNISLEKDALDFLDTLRSQGKASVIVADSDKIIGVIGLSDTLKPNVKEMVSELEKMNTKSVLLTGDNKKAAEFFAEKIGLKELYSDLLPSEKVDYVEKLKESGKVCMVGDGVNDAPALKIADVGVAMGGIGSDISVEAADVALMTDDISKISYLKWLSNETVKTIKTAITLSMTINFIAIILSVTGVLNPTTGALVHNAGSCFVVLLAARLYDKKFK